MEFQEILERTIAAEGPSISVITLIVWSACWVGLSELIYFVINATACAKHGGLKRTRI